MEIRLIKHGSEEYDRMVQLRTYTLLDPIGVPASYIVRDNEQKDVLIGAFKENSLIGCCILTEKNNQTVQLRQMAVHPRQQGSGIGAAVLLFAESEARRRGYGMLMMHARAAVCNFYEKCGYKKAGGIFYEVGIPHFVMEKHLEH